MTLEQYLSDTVIITQKNGLKQMVVTPKATRLYLCNCVVCCDSKVNGFCTANVRYCNHRVALR